MRTRARELIDEPVEKLGSKRQTPATRRRGHLGRLGISLRTDTLVSCYPCSLDGSMVPYLID